MRAIIWLLALTALLTACRKHNKTKPPLSELEFQQRLVGTWELLWESTNGSAFESSVTVTSNGNYICDAPSFSPTSYKLFHIEGSWVMSNDFIIDTALKHSNTNARLPMITCEKIIRFDTNELVLQFENYSNHFVQAVFHKKTRN
jgi:hypothetical protein